jgi:proteasome accessory factor B
MEALRATKRGLTVVQLIERTASSRASIYRDLDILRGAGLTIDKVPANGEMRYVLAAVSGTSATRATPLQLAALITARRALSPLEGTRLTRELDLLIRQLSALPRPPSRVHIGLSHALAPERLSIIDRALEQSRCVRIRYRGTTDAAASWRTVEPVELRVSAEQPYLVAYDRSSERFKIYKLARMTQVQPLRERARALANYQPEKLFAQTRGIWSGDVHEVAVRLSREVARFAGEWPLHKSQSVTDLAQGAVVVRARVAGLREPLRWVLSWGRRAEVLEPAELRELVIAELTAALRSYRGDRERAKRRVSSVETGTA